MKTLNLKNQLIYIISITTMMMVLFYHQWYGLNFFIFNLIIQLIAWKFIDNTSSSKKHTLIYSVCLCLLSISCAWYGDGFSAFLYVLYLIPIGFFFFDNSKEVLSSYFNSIYYVIGSIILTDKILKKNKLNIKTKNIWFYIIPLFVFLFLIPLYLNINQNFKDFVLSISLPKVNIDFFILLILCLFFALYFVLYTKSKRFYKLKKRKENSDNSLSINHQNWINSGVMLFIIACLLLLSLLIYDFQSLVKWEESLSNNSAYSKYVWDGVSSVILSISIATALIMFYTSVTQNQEGKPFKYLMLLWMLLNILLVISCISKNIIYVSKLGLTHRRIGVFIFLSLSIIGLVFAIIKIYRKKNNVFLIRNMTWIFFVFIPINQIINWSSVITNYNISQYQKGNIDLDIYYLKSLPYNLSALEEFSQNNPSDKYAKIYLQSIKPEKQLIIHNETKTKRSDWRSKAFYYEYVNYQFK